MGFRGLESNNALSRLVKSYNGLKNRPDYDGFVTIDEGVKWAKSHPNASAHPTPENKLYLNAGKLDFGNINISDFKNGVGKNSPINTFNPGNTIASANNAILRASVYALGRIDMQLLDKNGNVKMINNHATTYDWNKGGGFWRSSFINFERWRADVGDKEGFQTVYYGTGKLNQSVPLSEPGIEDGRLP